MATAEATYTIVGGIIAAACGLVAKLTADLIGLWKFNHQKVLEQHKEDATLEGIRTQGIVELLNDYRQQVASLKTELMAQATRYAQAMQTAEDRHTALETEHYRVMAELTKVQAELAVLRARLDGE